MPLRTVTVFPALLNGEVSIRTNKGNTGYPRKYVNEILYQEMLENKVERLGIENTLLK